MPRWVGQHFESGGNDRTPFVTTRNTDRRPLTKIQADRLLKAGDHPSILYFEQRENKTMSDEPDVGAVLLLV